MKEWVHEEQRDGPGIELCRASAPTTLPMDYATEADDIGPTGVSQIPRREAQHQSDPQVSLAPQFTRPQPLGSTIHVSQDRTRPLLLTGCLFLLGSS